MLRNINNNVSCRGVKSVKKKTKGNSRHTVDILMEFTSPVNSIADETCRGFIKDKPFHSLGIFIIGNGLYGREFNFLYFKERKKEKKKKTCETCVGKEVIKVG